MLISESFFRLSILQGSNDLLPRTISRISPPFRALNPKNVFVNQNPYIRLCHSNAGIGVSLYQQNDKTATPLTICSFFISMAFYPLAYVSSVPSFGEISILSCSSFDKFLELFGLWSDKNVRLCINWD